MSLKFILTSDCWARKNPEWMTDPVLENRLSTHTKDFSSFSQRERESCHSSQFSDYCTLLVVYLHASNVFLMKIECFVVREQMDLPFGGMHEFRGLRSRILPKVIACSRNLASWTSSSLEMPTVGLDLRDSIISSSHCRVIIIVIGTTPYPVSFVYIQRLSL